MIESALAQRSRGAFAQEFPDLMARLEQPDAPTSAVMFDGDVAVDIAIGDRRVYGADARIFAADQVEAYMEKPLRMFMERPNSSGLTSPICVSVVQKITKELTERGIEEISLKPIDSPTFLIVFGIGLGHHLLDLARATKARWLVLVEPHLEFIAHSFHALDWSALIEHVDAQGGSIHVVTDDDPALIAGAVANCEAQHGIPYADGAWVFTHYPHWSFGEARTRLYQAVDYAFVNRGFFEDELVMMSNTVANFTARPVWLLDGRPRLHRPETAVIVGAGPSLDESFETLHRIRDRVVLFSSGTALRPLLRNGLVPDFHCELENVPEVVAVLQETAKYGDLSQIPLVASSTVDPRVPPMFRESILFFRDSVSSTQLLAEKYRPISGSAPTCVNTAISAAAFFGFTEVLLFGTDCGIRPGGARHASATVYRDAESLSGVIAERTVYSLEVEGNFGGVARTDFIYDACRRMLAEVIRGRCLTAVNCSDGALIPGALPRIPETVEVAGPPIDRERLATDLRKTLDPFATGDLVRDADFPALVEKTKDFFRDLKEALDAFDPKAADFAGVFEAIRTIIETTPPKHGKVLSMWDGTLYALPRLGMFYGFRMKDTAARRLVFEVFMTEIREICGEMERRTIELFERLAREIEGARRPHGAGEASAA